jgi:hypothetical protein
LPYLSVSSQTEGLKSKKLALPANQAEAVLQGLEPFIEAEGVAENDAPVRAFTAI